MVLGENSLKLNHVLRKNQKLNFFFNIKIIKVNDDLYKLLFMSPHFPKVDFEAPHQPYQTDTLNFNMLNLAILTNSNNFGNLVAEHTKHVQVSQF